MLCLPRPCYCWWCNANTFFAHDLLIICSLPVAVQQHFTVAIQRNSVSCTSVVPMFINRSCSLLCMLQGEGLPVLEIFSSPEFFCNRSIGMRLGPVALIKIFEINNIATKSSADCLSCTAF